MASTGNSSEELSTEFTEKLILFQEVTGIDDLERCKAILRQFSWNVENAINGTMAEDHSPAPMAPPQIPELRRRVVASSSTHSLPSTRRSEINIYRAAVRRNNQPVGFFGWTAFFIALPFRFTCSTLLSMFRFVVRIFLPDPRARITNPRGDVTSFVNEFKEKYGSNTPNFFMSTYAEALSQSRSSFKFLVVYLHSGDHLDTDEFCRGTICNNDVIQLINRNAVFWACSVDKPEGYRVSKALRENTYPFIAIISQLDGRMTVIGRLEGPLTSQEFMLQVSAIIEKYEPTLIALRSERAERDQTQRLRSEQDEAYEASLLLDRQKEEQRKQKEQLEREQQDEEIRKKHDKINAVELLKCRKQLCLESLPTEPDPSNSDAIKLVVKLPDGTRLKRTFLRTDTVEILHNYVFSHENSPMKIGLMHNFPPKPVPFCNSDFVFTNLTQQINKENESKHKFITLSEAGLKNSDVLFVQSHADETDESDS